MKPNGLVTIALLVRTQEKQLLEICHSRPLLELEGSGKVEGLSQMSLDSRCPHMAHTGHLREDGKGGGRKADVASGVERRRLDLSKREGGESGPLSLSSVPPDHSRHEQEQDRRGAAGETVRPAEGAQAWRAELLDLLLPSSLTSPESAASSQRTSRMKQK